MPETRVSDMLNKKLNDSIIDSELTLDILSKYNRGNYDNVKPVVPMGFPPVDNKTIIDMTNGVSFSGTLEEITQSLKKYKIQFDLPSGNREMNITLPEDKLRLIGEQLMPLYSFGILNGGSATSYADSKKNKSFNSDLFTLLEDQFNLLSKLSTGKAKGLTPAFLNPDGSPGPSFIELKMRSLLINNCPSLFQMTSFFNDDSIKEAYSQYEKSPYLKDLIEKKGINICDAETGVQPLLAAFTHSRTGKTKTIYEKNDGELLPLPGGHGQCFITLKKTFENLYAKGIRFVSIGNVDNSGYTPDPLSLAILALSGKQAGFDFSYKTPVDVKGGILIKDDSGHLNCADLGVAIDKAAVDKAVNRGEPILFNCATGLFNLEFLVNNIDEIIQALPMRFSDQDKDAGLYSQAEQVTWEVIGQLDSILIFAIDKYERFLAAKTIMENLMTSGIKLQDKAYPRSEKESEDLRTTAIRLNNGLERKLKTDYGLELIEGRWTPMTAEKLENYNVKTGL